ncbi:MAG: glycosyl hydrolase, partial [Ardenticatenaceae bacterium]
MNFLSPRPAVPCRPIPVVLLGLLLLALLASPAVAQEPTSEVAPLPPVPQNDPFFGIVQAIHDPDKAVAAGVGWERLVVWWANFQPEGPTDWTADGWFPRNLIEDQKNRGIEPVGVVLHTPGWAARDGTYDVVSPPRNLDLPFDHPENYWGQFLMRLASEYAGLVDHWILWNEPDIYKDSFANWAGTPEEFARMQVVGYQAIKRGNPGATVILSGTTYWWDLENERPLYLERLLDALVQSPGAAEHATFFDAVAVHQYSNPLNSYAVPVLYRRVLDRYGLQKPIWIVESNVVPHDDPRFPLHRGGLRATMEEQASYMIQSAALARAAGVERYSIYKMMDEGAENDQYFGLVRNDGSVRPAYVAYQTAVREMSNATDARYFWSGATTPPTRDEITALLAST